MKKTFYYKGWFGFCPVYLDKPTAEGACLEARHPALMWLLFLSVSIYSMCFKFAQMMNPEFEPLWPIKVSGKLNKPIVVEA